MIFRALRNIGREVRNVFSESIQQYQAQQQQQQLLLQQQQQTTPFPAAPFPRTNPGPPPTATSTWPLLILPSHTPSRLFTALLNALFTLSLPSDSSVPVSLDILTPTRLAAIYDLLGYPPSDNLPFLLHQQAQRCCDADPRVRVNEGMTLAWQVFRLEYTTGVRTDGTTVPGLTRRGLMDMMIRDGLIYPPGQAQAYSALLARRRGELVAKAGVEFPIGPIGAESFMPTGEVSTTGHVETQRVYKEREALWGEEYRRRFGGGEMGGQGQGEWQMAMAMGNWRHNMVMDALTPGYRVGDRVYYTGGLSW